MYCLLLSPADYGVKPEIKNGHSSLLYELNSLIFIGSDVHDWLGAKKLA
jgi:hypothetical protein